MVLLSQAWLCDVLFIITVTGSDLTLLLLTETNHSSFPLCVLLEIKKNALEQEVAFSKSLPVSVLSHAINFPFNT